MRNTTPPKERQRLVQARLDQLQKRLGDLSMVDMSQISHDKIGLGSTVLVLDVKKDEEVTYKLVTSEESDVRQGPDFDEFTHRTRVHRQGSGRCCKDSDSRWHCGNLRS